MAKVLTADEVLQLPHRKALKTVPVVIEEKVPFGSWNKGSILKWVGSDFAREWFIETQRRAATYAYKLGYVYGKNIRIWDMMPTAEELQEAEWDG